MRYDAPVSRSAVAIALVALGALAGVAPAEARRKPPGGPHGRDTTPPTITCPSDVVVEQKARFGGSATFTVTVADDKDPAPMLTVSPPSGSTFPVGTTTVTATATDWKGNSSSCTFDVTVTPAEVPTAYTAYFTDADGYPYVEWDIAVAADGTVSGTGHQTALLLSYGGYSEYGIGLPSGLSGSGTLSGTIGADGSCVFESSTTYWVWVYGDHDADGNPVYTQRTAGFSGTVNAGVDVYGNLWFSSDPLGSPSFWGDGIWFPK